VLRSGVLMLDGHDAGASSTQGGGIEGKYANYFQIGHNAFEFLIDFGQLYSDGRRETFHSRIITSPPYVKELFTLLGAAIEQYEQTFGSILGHE
jgi:hypothetical protein